MTAEVAVMAEGQDQKVEVTCEQLDQHGQKTAKVAEQRGEDVKPDEGEKTDGDVSKPVSLVGKSSSYQEESNFLSDLKESDRKALSELKSKLEEAILGNTLFSNEEKNKEKHKQFQNAEKVTKEECLDARKKEQEPAEKAPAAIEECNEQEVADSDGDSIAFEVDRDVSLWGVPLLPSIGFEGTDVILLKFLRAREFKVNDAFEMLRKTLNWRKNLNIDSIKNIEDEFGPNLASAAYMNGYDRQGHPVCYNTFDIFSDEDAYSSTFGTEEKREQFLMWRFQFMEKGIKKLDFRPGGVTSILQVYDLKNCPGPSKKELRNTTFKAIGLLQDNYPELVAKNVFVNVPFWYYAFFSLVAPFLTQRSKSKLVVARPAKVTETLLKYIPIDEIPTQYGGFKREDDIEYSMEVSELFLKAGATETIEIPTSEVGQTTIWDVAVLGGEVNHREEFVPADEGSYTVIVQKEKKLNSVDGPTRNSFRNNEAGKIIITIANTSNKKKKRVFCRHTCKKASSSV